MFHLYKKFDAYLVSSVRTFIKLQKFARIKRNVPHKHGMADVPLIDLCFHLTYSDRVYSVQLKQNNRLTLT